MSTLFERYLDFLQHLDIYVPSHVHVYWNIVACDIKQPISLTQQLDTELYV